jgi:ATP-binding cassette subfamily B protein
VASCCVGKALPSSTPFVGGLWRFGRARHPYIRSQVYVQLQRLSAGLYDKREVGAVMSRVQNDTGMVAKFPAGRRGKHDSFGAHYAGVVRRDAGVLVVSWLFGLAAGAAVVCCYQELLARPDEVMATCLASERQPQCALADSLSGVRVVRAFAQEDREIDRYLAKSGEVRDATMRSNPKRPLFIRRWVLLWVWAVPRVVLRWRE